MVTDTECNDPETGGLMARKTKTGNNGARGQRTRAIGNFIINKRSIVPNIITMTNMTMGFFAIIYASRGDARSLAIAGILIFIGSLCDASDGAVARAMHVESPVGLHLDSLADGIAYGIAPAVIAYQAFLSKLPESMFGLDSGMLLALIYPICAIYRLARFNIAAEDDEEHNGFTGLPSPAAGIIISSIPALPLSVLPFIGRLDFQFPLEVFIPLYVVVSLLMVSHVDYSKLFYDLYRKGKIVAVTTVVVVILLLVFFRMWSVFVTASLYMFAGLVIYAVRHVRKGRGNGTEAP